LPIHVYIYLGKYKLHFTTTQILKWAKRWVWSSISNTNWDLNVTFHIGNGV
jgi:hypothetical protein